MDYQGEINVIKGLVAKSERKALKALHDEKAKKSTKGEQGTQNASGDKAANTSTSAPVVEYSNAMSDDLKAHCLIMAKHALMLNSNLAIDALHYSLCIRAFVPFGSTPLDVSVNRTDLEPKQGDFAENQALARIEAHKDNLDLTWLEVNDSKERFEAFVKLDADEKQKQVAYASALMLRPSMAQDDGRFDFEFLYQELSFDAADYWRPSTDSFLKRIDKDSLIDIGRPVMSDEWIKSCDSLKKGDLVKQMDVWLDGADKSLTEPQKAHFAKWMPQGF